MGAKPMLHVALPLTHQQITNDLLVWTVAAR
jgi:hypothetical protein